MHLPLSWDDPATQLAIEKYMQSVRPDAPWCPSNIEFIRRINGLDSIEDVKRIVFDASYLVLGLGDVYLGAPVATPLDPRHRLVTTKYNPARTWTAENSVGIGGAYLCVYGMEGPGGYQFVGRTVQMWNTWRTTKEFTPGTRGCCGSSIRSGSIRWSAEELLDMRDRFPHGKVRAWIFRKSSSGCAIITRSWTAFGDQRRSSKDRQQAAFEAERERWTGRGIWTARWRPPMSRRPSRQAAARRVAGRCKSPAHASVWHIAVKAGDRVEEGQRLVVVESMKMEIAVAAPEGGTVVEMLCAQGAQVTAGQSLLFVRPE